VVPLLVTAFTGALYRFLRNVVGYEKHQVHWLMEIHQGELSEWFSVIYVSLLAVGTLTMLVSGYTMISRQKNALFTFKVSTGLREFHQTAAFFLLPLLTISAVTGASYKIAWDVLGIQDKTKVSWLLTIHQGSYIPGATVCYTLSIFILVAIMASSGTLLLPYIRNKLNPPRVRERKPRETKPDELPLIVPDPDHFSDKNSAESEVAGGTAEPTIDREIVLNEGVENYNGLRKNNADVNSGAEY